MKLFAWLWNPWDEYKLTRHNAGFLILDLIKEKYNFENFRFEKKFGWEISRWKINNIDIILLKPMEYMNLSGLAVSRAKNFFKLEAKDILIIYDDMDVETWKTKIKKSGSSGWHNWIKSIIEKLSTQDFWRIKIWIGRPARQWVEHVLWKFSPVELEKIIYDTNIEENLKTYFLETK